MYWFFSPPGWGLMLWLLSILLILIGGWLLATHVCTLDSGERLLAGFGLGLVAYIWIVNWLGRLAPPFWAFLGGALIVLLLGILSAYPFRGRWLDFDDLRIGPWIAAGIALCWVFLRISKGTGLFDETSNLATISTIANGQIPVLAYFGEASLHRYHYAMHFLGAGMMQLGRFTPWSAFDLSKAMVWSLSLLLTGLVGKRYLRIPYGSVLLAGAWALAGGSRWLLLLIPSRLLAVVEQHVTLRGIASGTLSAALSSTLPMELSPPIGYPFAFLSGINQSFVMAHGGEQTFEPILLMLAVLLLGRPARRYAIALFAILFSLWALASETSFVLVTLSLTILAAVRYFRGGRRWEAVQPLGPALIGLALALPIVLVQGGVISSMAQQVVFNTPIAGPPSADRHFGLLGFYPRWPPAILSGQMGSMPLTDPWALFAGVLEMGVIVIMLPWCTWRWWRGQSDSWPLPFLLLIAWLGVLIPMFVAWVADSNITHITDLGLDVSVVILVFMLAAGAPPDAARRRRAFEIAGAMVLALMLVPGIVLMGIQLTAAHTVVLSEHYGDAEGYLLQQVWGRLPPDSKILGHMGPSSTLTGQLTAGIWQLPPGDERAVWEEMLTSPRLQPLIEHGFDFVYMDSRSWNQLDTASRQELRDPCITTFARGEDFTGGNVAEILDLRGCR
jgi:hypothetical protein